MFEPLHEPSCVCFECRVNGNVIVRAADEQHRGLGPWGSGRISEISAAFARLRAGVVSDMQTRSES